MNNFRVLYYGKLIFIVAAKYSGIKTYHNIGIRPYNRP